ncbi:MAG: nucleotide-diphospho-sugar transferase [Sphingobacteriales bacterium]|nr:MAG: nucleotide-diphospho-sugar transferase [Sphingobacteriales bacterium]
MNSLKTPVLLLVFNRPDNTLKVFEAIALAKPEKLYIAADGPRPNNTDDEILCAETRKIIEHIDWPCKLHTLFRQENLGARYACTTAFDWFFEQEEEGIILEDDCVPGMDFFNFCAQLLEKYRHDPRIMHIGGTNLQFGNKRGSASYYFSSIPAVWGWASWRRVWKNYDPEMAKFEKFEQENQMINVFPDKRIADWVSVMARMIYEKKVIAWDYPLAFHVGINNGLCIVPNVNLVTNIGFGNQSTHTKDSSHAHANIPIQAMEEPLIHPKFFIPHKHADFYQLNLTINDIKANEVNKVKKVSKVSVIQKIKNKIKELIK